MKRLSKFLLLMVLCFTLTGCFGSLMQLLALPFQVAGKAIDVAGQVATKVPAIPGVF